MGYSGKGITLDKALSIAEVEPRRLTALLAAGVKSPSM
jgi:hypothetical protein